MIPDLAFIVAAYAVPRLWMTVATAGRNSDPNHRAAFILTVILAVAGTLGVVVGLVDIMLAGSKISALPGVAQ